jgi:hypothetical protein
MDVMPENIVPTAGTETESGQTTTQVEQTPAPAAPVTPEKTWTKSQIVEMMKKRVARSHNAFFKRYGVQDLKGLDELFEKSKKFSEMDGQFGTIQLKNSELMRENAFLRNNISPDKYNDIIAHFKGSGIEFSEDELLKALPTHPEWLKQPEVPTTTIKTLGAETHVVPPVDEAEKASKLLGVKL